MAITKTQNPLATSATATLAKPQAATPAPKPVPAPTQPADKVTLSPQAKNSAVQKPATTAQAQPATNREMATQRAEAQNRTQATTPPTATQAPNKPPVNPVDKMV